MLSVLIETRDDEEGLARTLASLIGAVVEGVVREVLVCDLGSTDQTHYVAEHAGCHFLARGGIGTAITMAKCDWLLFLEPGARLVEGWGDAVIPHLNKSEMPARFSTARSSRPPFLARIFAGNRALAQGLLITKRQAASLAKHATGAEALARGLAVKTLEAEMLPAKRS
jgi:hypothetical protein